jgi:elongation factor Ts
MNDLELLKKLREETGAGVMDCKKALEENSNDLEKAKEQLTKLGLEKAAKKSDREIKAGLVDAYLHTTGRVGAVVALGCETDFVARTEDFKKLSREVAMQAAAMKPKDIEELLAQAYIRDGSKTVKDLLVALTAKVGENIIIKDFKVLEV